MIASMFNRRAFSLRLAWCFSGLGLVRTSFGSAGSPRAPALAGDEEVSHKSESIHQEVVFKATRKRVYEAITDAGQFSKVTKFSTVPDAPLAEISRDAGGSFSLFGGHIVGRHVELVPNQRIVQAWRVVDWDPGIYSIARFELEERGPQTRLVFDHTGFPNGWGEHLAEGWKSNYWEPLGKHLS
ncbi:MAG: SRPBCC domain-containing protein [Terriglobia bacterium]